MLNLSANTLSTGYNISNSLRFRAAGTTYMSRTPASAGNRRTWTLSAWVKVATSNGSEQRILNAYVDSSCLYIYNQFGYSGIYTTPVFRDPSAWYHVVWVYDTTQATASNRLKIYVNGVQQTLQAYGGGAPTYPVLNFQGEINSVVQHDIGGYGSAPYVGTSIFDGYMAEYNFIDGQALTPSSFGSTNATTGVWQPAQYTGTYGTNGFYQKYSDIATTSGSNVGLGKDFSGNGNYYNTTNISVTAGTTYDAMKDSPTLTSATVANYAVGNPLALGTGTLSNGNLNLLGASAAWGVRSATIGMDSGKWYCEVTPLSGSTTQGNQFGITSLANPPAPISTTGGWVYYGFDGKFYANGAAGVTYGATVADNDVVGIAFDRDAGTLTFYKNNVSQGTAATGLTSGTYWFVFASYGTATSAINFGQRPFTYTPPSGYVALNTYNLPTPTILQGNKYMDATTFTATSGAQSIVNAGAFKPDLVWLKARVAQNHYWVDSVRGGTSLLQGNITNAESIYSTPNWISSFNSNGFSSDTASLLTNAYAYVAWQWQAGQGSTSSNTDGTVTSTVSASTTAGFSVVTFTAPNASSPRTIGHGLGVAPKMVIMKYRSSSSSIGWVVYHSSMGATQYIVLNSTAAAVTSSIIWNNTAPTSTVFTIGSNYVPDAGLNTLVAYCWAEIAGFSKFGSYTGNGSADGPFVYCGFRPKFILLKCSSVVSTWLVLDSARSTYNVMAASLFPSTSGAEDSTYNQIDFLSNGFKMRADNANSWIGNVSGNTYIYAAFAENPFKNALAR
jgi:hypothetical protein